jgi:hypothetical protein
LTYIPNFRNAFFMSVGTKKCDKLHLVPKPL